MTTHIPLFTLPEQVFAQPVLSILLPIAIGTGVGFAITRTDLPYGTFLRNAS